jgi:hypothetical protein
MNQKFVIRGLLFALPAALIIAVVWLLLQTPLGKPIEPTPPPPIIRAPRDDVPAGPIGLEARAQYRGGSYELVGCGFLLSLAGGEIVGVTTAHSVSIGDPDHPLEQIALGVAGQSDSVGEFDTLWGQPGRARTGEDMTVDYLLLQVDVSVEPGLILHPDPRGAPQPGERVSLYSGLGDDQSGRRVLEGTVMSIHNTAVWVLMDQWFNPGMMSGSPIVSQHTGRAVGMAIAASPRRNRLLVGTHPIGSLVQLAESATDFPRIAELSLE